MEEFRKVPNYEYSVSNMGNVRNDKTNRILQPGINSRGYYNVNLYKNGKRKNMTVHKLVANTFIANLDYKQCIDHKNNNKLDNNINNLRWATNTENSRNRNMNSNNSSGYKGVVLDKKTQKWSARITIDGIKIHIGYYTTIKEAAKARLDRARYVFGQYINACEGIQHEAKPMKIRKPKPVVVKPIELPIVKQIEKPNEKKSIQQIYENIITLKDNYKNDLLNMQNALKIVLKM
jgi:hypothetical protein